MKIILNDGTEITGVSSVTISNNIIGENKKQSANILFDNSSNFEKFKELFTEENCSSIKVVNDNQEEKVLNEFTNKITVYENITPDQVIYSITLTK